MRDVDVQSWNDDERDVLRENTAQSINDELEAQDNLRQRYERRWIWELFQNALDAAAGLPSLEIRLRFGQSFIFSHNGAPFSRKELLHLIFHGSTKRESTELIGRYGTGFLTTHVLSRRVHVRGRLQSGELFAFTLDRSGTTPKQLMDAMGASRTQLFESLSSAATDTESWTEFEYPLSDSSNSQLIRPVVSDLNSIAVAVMAFNPKIKSITMSGNHEARYELVSKKGLNDNSYLIQVGDPDHANEMHYMAIANDDDLGVALLLGEIENRLSVLSPDNVPRMFVAFPLFGTEVVPLPFLVNVSAGIPTDERNGLYLGSDNSRETNTRNKAFIERAWPLYHSLIDVAMEQEWESPHRLAVLTPCPKFDWLDSQWMQGQLKNNAEKLALQKPVAESTAHVLIPPCKMTFPVGVPEAQFEQFHKLIEEIYHEPVILSKLAWLWDRILQEWHQLGVTSALTEVNPAALINKVAALGNLESLSRALGGSADPIDWLNRLLVLLTDCKADWTNANLVPNQIGILTPLPKLLADKGIEEELKDIAQLFGIGIRHELLNTRIAPFIQALIAPYDQEKLVGLLLSAARTLKSTVSPQNQAAANVRLLRWLIRKRRINDLKTYAYFVRATDPKGAPCLSSASTQLLASAEVWSESGRPFVELFPAAHVLSSTYTSLLEPSDWQFLYEQSICTPDPIIRTSRSLSADELSAMMESLPSTDLAEHILAPTEVSDIQFLTVKDGVLDGARSSKLRSIMLIRFLFDYVVPSTPGDLEYRTVQCSCGNTHMIHSAAWVPPIRDRKWVYESRNHAAHVSSVSLSRLLKDDSALMARLADEPIFRVLARLGVSPSDLSRAALDLPTDQMAKLERAVLGVLSASNNDPRRLEQITDLISSAPEMLTEFEERKKTRDRIHKNQQVGALVEELFEELFGSAEIRDLGLRLRRAPIGSDFAFENDLVEGGQENLLGINTAKRELLVELKSTLGSSAAMTHTQAKLASNTEHGFALCVVPLEDRNPSIEIVRTNSRFVLHIGSLLKAKVGEVTDLEARKVLTTTASAGIQVSINDSEIRYRIADSVWASGKTTDEFVRYLLEFFSS
jgi:hypothetical protein